MVKTYLFKLKDNIKGILRSLKMENDNKIKPLELHKKNESYKTNKKQIFIIGSKGIPANYGGFETFVEKLTEYQKSNKFRYHVARLSNEKSRYEYNGAKCFNVPVPKIGMIKAVYYDLIALKHCIKYCKERPSIKEPIFYILACRIGPFINFYKKKINKLGGKLYINPDGHEWKRAKWSAPVRKYWKISERLMVKNADLLICDSKGIEKYILNEYKKYHPNTTFIAYGSDKKPSTFADDNKVFNLWLSEKNLKIKEYYLVVGRFVPENNYETMIREFMKSNTNKSFVLITNVTKGFLNDLKVKTKFDKDSRIKFVGTVYDQELLKKIREQAYGYFHGHEVGGTNPSLIEALGSTDLNLLLDVEFNREVGEDGALYWNKENGSLASLIEKADSLSEVEILNLRENARKRINDFYNWDYIVDKYEDLWINENIE